MPYDVKQAAVQAVIEAWKNLQKSSEGNGVKLHKALNDLVIAYENKE